MPTISFCCSLLVALKAVCDHLGPCLLLLRHTQLATRQLWVLYVCVA